MAQFTLAVVIARFPSSPLILWVPAPRALSMNTEIGPPGLNTVPFHIIARAPILYSRAVLAKALFCPYMELCRASMILQDAAMLSLTCHEQTTGYSTYGKAVVRCHGEPHERTGADAGHPRGILTFSRFS